VYKAKCKCKKPGEESLTVVGGRGGDREIDRERERRMRLYVTWIRQGLASYNIQQR